MGKTQSKSATTDNTGTVNTNNNIELITNIEEDTDKVTILLTLILCVLLIQFVYHLYSNKVKDLKSKIVQQV